MVTNKSRADLHRDYYPMTFYPDSIKNIVQIIKNSSRAAEVSANFKQEAISFPVQKSYYLRYLKTTQSLLGWLVIWLLPIIVFVYIFVGFLPSTIPAIIAALLVTIRLIIVNYKKLLNKQSMAINRKILAREYLLIAIEKNNNQSFSNLLLDTLDKREGIYSFNIVESKKGLSESYFLDHLETWFGYPWRIIEHCQFNRENYTPTADFVLINDDLKLAVDLEIDEPYTIKDNLPIHLVEDKKYIFRDNFFLDLGYIVIRFAEYQIVKHPDYCCLHIARVLNQFLEQDMIIRSPNIEIESLRPEDWRVKSWTKRESEIMAQNKVRDGYLKPIQEFNSSLENQD